MSNTKEREAFEAFVKQWTGKDMAFHKEYQTTGLEFAWACWQTARASLPEQAAQAEPASQPVRVQPLSDEQLWRSNDVMAANAEIGLPMHKLVVLKHAIERALCEANGLQLNEEGR